MTHLVLQQIPNKGAFAHVTAFNQPGGAAGFDALSDETLRTVGLSRPKIEYAHGLADTMASRTLDLDSIARHPSENAVPFFF